MSSSKDDVATGGENKESWPEVVGKTIEEAKAIILKDKPDAIFIVLPENGLNHEDLRPKHVRLYVRADGTVAHITRAG
ncbi:unnamed protein product [Alopecurus aequalis]